MEPLIVSHFTAVTCLGAGRAALSAALREGRSGLAPCRFETVTIPTYAGEVPGIDDMPLEGDFAGFDCRNNRLARMAFHQDGFDHAVAAARERHGADRIAVVLGSSTSGILCTELGYRARSGNNGALPVGYDYERTHNAFSIARFAAQYLSISGPATALSAACATTAKAFASAARLIGAGFCDAAIVGGADSLCLTTLYGFHSLELTAEGPCRPFDRDRDGISIGEAAGFVLLERARTYRGPSTLALLGTGESGDAYHMSSPHPEGVGAKLAMERALAAAGLAPDAVDYVNLHGTATKMGDQSEDRAVCGVFGTDVPCSSTKGFTGHTLGAAGVVEAVIAALAIEEGFIPGSPTTQMRDGALQCNFLTQGRAAPLRVAMSNSFGFGGSNCSVILGRA